MNTLTPADCTEVHPVDRYIMFTFPGDVWNETVSEKTSWGFEFQVSTANTKQPPRWGLVQAVGDMVNSDLTDPTISPGDYILIEPLMWTQHQLYKKSRIWYTSVEKVMAVSSELPAP